MPEFVLPEGNNEEPISILVKMVKDGLVDPWNIDIADLTDKFLAELEARREMNLRVSGLTIFYLSVLLRLKAESLEEPEEEEDEYEGEYTPYDEDEGTSERALGEGREVDDHLTGGIVRSGIDHSTRISIADDDLRCRRKRIIDGNNSSIQCNLWFYKD